MTALLTDRGARRLLMAQVGAAAPEALLVRLFANDHVPARDDAAADYVELEGHGYRAERVAPGDWRIRRGDDGWTAEAAVAEWTFQEGYPAEVFGYVVLGESSGDVYWAERFTPERHGLAAPLIVHLAGERLRVVLRVSGVAMPAGADS